MSIWNVRNVCETNGWFWICVGMVIVILTVLSGVPSGISTSDDCSQQKETDKNAAWRCQMKRAPLFLPPPPNLSSCPLRSFFLSTPFFFLAPKNFLFSSQFVLRLLSFFLPLSPIFSSSLPNFSSSLPTFFFLSPKFFLPPFPLFSSSLPNFSSSPPFFVSCGDYMVVPTFVVKHSH